MKAKIVVRDASPSDVPAIQEIYGHHVIHGRGSFEEAPPDAAEMRRRFEDVRALGLPYIVAVEKGRVLGYAYAGLYRTRPAYRFTVENSVYVRADRGGRGIGSMLLDELIRRCAAAGRRLMVAVIGDSRNVASIALHARAGFLFSGVIRNVGYKHGLWLDTVIMELPLGEGANTHPPAPARRTAKKRGRA